MKVSHRNAVKPWFAMPESDPVDDGYAAEVQRTTERAEREFQRVQESLKRAEQRLAKAQAQKSTTAQKRITRRLEALIIERRAELAALELLMIPAKPDRKLRFRTGRDDHLELGIVIDPQRASTYRRGTASEQEALRAEL